ncbi:MAG: hypothetical protein ACI90V_007208 [Bacillariaceae sp.]|jgi:hypothetical protein
MRYDAKQTVIQVVLVFNDYTIDSYFSNGKRQGGLAISILRL